MVSIAVQSSVTASSPITDNKTDSKIKTNMLVGPVFEDYPIAIELINESQTQIKKLSPPS